MITVKQMQELEQKAVQQGISIADLMENAGKAVFEVVKEKYDLNDKKIIIFAGHGNNGGDGFVAAKHFATESSVLVLFFGWEDNLSKEARDNYDEIKDKVNMIPILKKEDLDQFHFQKNLDYIFIDAILGTGVKGKLREPLSFAIDYFNSLRGIKVAVDLPSGLDPDTGEVHDKACEVDLIVCFHDLKFGLGKFKEKTVVRGIGIPK